MARQVAESSCPTHPCFPFRTIKLSYHVLIAHTIGSYCLSLIFSKKEGVITPPDHNAHTVTFWGLMIHLVNLMFGTNISCINNLQKINICSKISISNIENWNWINLYIELKVNYLPDLKGVSYRPSRNDTTFSSKRCQRWIIFNSGPVHESRGTKGLIRPRASTRCRPRTVVALRHRGTLCD